MDDVKDSWNIQCFGRLPENPISVVRQYAHFDHDCGPRRRRVFVKKKLREITFENEPYGISVRPSAISQAFALSWASAIVGLSRFQKEKLGVLSDRQTVLLAYRVPDGIIILSFDSSERNTYTPECCFKRAARSTE